AAFHVSDAETFYKAGRTGAVEAALHTPPFERFLQFVQYPLWVTEPLAGGRDTRVQLLDLRFGNPREIGFAATAIVNENNQVAESAFGMAGSRPR
ncbi:MAG: hypothetical protein ABUS49_05445, partial [Acidobacteriota bacterium]